MDRWILIALKILSRSQQNVNIYPTDMKIPETDLTVEEELILNLLVPSLVTPLHPLVEAQAFIAAFLLVYVFLSWRTGFSKQPIRTRYLGHVTGYQ